MRLKSFATYGFKSFADKTELTFDKGITAVVGPNGSGKSNISDAIRWALGEQSAKYLRGSKMEDVIFSGSGKRRALGVAEVSLEFDNSDHTLPLDFEQVSLTRRLFRSGDSEYAINKKPCRLKDVIDLMADTGLGKGSMSIIGQNKIDEVLNSRPEERRGLFEEAAGIAKYRLRKKDAVKKLDDTALNLTRINDIRSEVDAQVEPLAQAAAKTKQYNSLSEELRLCRLSVLLRKLDNMAGVQAELNAKKQAAADEFSRQAALLSGREAEAAALQRQLDKLAEDYSKLQEEIKNQETALEKLRGKQGVLDERAEQSRRAAARLEQSNAKLAQQAEELESKMQSLAAEFDAVDKERARAALQTERLQKERDEQARLLNEVQNQNASAQSEFFAAMQALLKMRNELRALEQEQEQRMRRREALKKSIEEAEAAAAKIQEQYNRLLEAQVRCQHDAELLRTDADALQTAAAAAQKNITQITVSQQQCQRQLTMAEAKEQGLRRMQRAYEGFGYGVKAALKAQTPWRQQLLGVAAELITVEDKYITAIETALGEGAQNIVAQSAEAAKAAIAYLKQTGGGRATFLPLDTVQRRSPNKEEEALAKQPGICGFAMDLLQSRAEAENALRFLLGRVLIAENLDAALAAARASRFRLRVVTLQGDVVNAGGSMTGGSRKQKEGYLSREAEIKQAQETAARLRQEMLSWQEQLEAQEEVAKTQGRKLQNVNEQLQQQMLKASEIKLRLEQVLQSKRRESENLALLLDDRSQVTNAYLQNRDKLKEMRAAVAQRESRDTEAKAQLEALQKQMAQLGSAVTALENNLQDARVLLETSAAKSSLMSERMQGLDQDTLRVRRDMAANSEEAGRLQQTIAECGAEKQRLQQQSENVLAELHRIMGGKDDFAQQRGELLLRQSQLEKEIAQARKQTGDSEAALRQTELALARQESDYQHVLEQLEQDYQLDEEQARQTDLQQLQALDLKALQKQESKLALAISALGPINAAAIEEYEAVKERSEFLRRQYDDLCTAKDNLEAVISEINSGMTKRFKEAFAKINEYFAKCYVKLFGGGTALLTLTQPDDLLNSGIDIEVQPPGKKLQSLYLMSGGERALTVIALLFALLSYQPSPFCILDEIDAPLDDANIQRFANFLRDYSGQTQFIVITHRKGTMEAADIMYGVTMEESGVSKLLSVKINAKES
ncbi:MAG: chromosome segregation protein SMC [Phascolarctobacterium sp.]|uniref:chromosome segregation protein SMC n=1 Tax=Phascolarctobacterium sp. TaxID=2049039 RepID=UPI0026DC8451|nr:chromosome segregation protein SMC [Phascolarctobacterium sp.]MDO4922294.1 chromosome segregation protein SMC [Phascolarctobacterium sp.]